jgi:hypothetical protein
MQSMINEGAQRCCVVAMLHNAVQMCGHGRHVWCVCMRTAMYGLKTERAWASPLLNERQWGRPCALWCG